jgi:LysR family hca operon transcriptional activator
VVRSVRGIELTAAGRAFLEHARLELGLTQAAIDAARRAAQPAKPSFAHPSDFCRVGRAVDGGILAG